MSDETKKIAWQGIRDFFLGGTFIFCLTILWQMAAFVQSVKDFQVKQKELQQEVDIKFSVIYNELDVLREWKVSVTQKPFYPGNMENTRAPR